MIKDIINLLKSKFNYSDNTLITKISITGENIEDFINEEYESYVLEDDDNLDSGALQLKRAWIVIIDRMKLYGVLKENK